MRHSPLPWIVETGPYSGKDWLIGSALNGEDYSITTNNVHASEMNGADAEDDAKFIVTACNSFEDLLEACKEAIQCLIVPADVDNLIPEAIRVLSEAIAKAEGE